MSVKDYLLSDQISSGAAAYYSINANQSHCLIVQTCLAYLVHLGILDSLDDASVATLPLAHYAAEHWTSHFQGCNGVPSPPSLQALLSHFFVSAPNVEGNDLISAGTYPPLSVAALLGLHETVQQLLLHSTSMGTGGFWYYKAIYGAACEGHHVIVELLVEHIPQINLSTVEESCGTAYVVASLRGRSVIASSHAPGHCYALWNVQPGIL
ncbi:hypothetical protein FIBSPDRAFT_959263 [Athelia psychrophila]|uniref:Ankyrin n=1 Tax=Athelia psychrophila TaxID=1759441 RepID=A0A166DQR5_9AGAM|nr:hypothetical protein FIBSPDRAFT_959263 [Fibularhizoctonia sp. CBS 109695]